MDILNYADKQADWDMFVDHAPTASPYHRFAWGQAVTEAYGFECHYFAAQADNQLHGILPVVEMRNLRGKKILCSLPYCDLGGAVSNKEEESSAEQLLCEYVIDFAKQRNISEVELRKSAKQCHPIEDAHHGEKVRMLLELPKTSDQLMASFKSKLRSQIRKAEKNGLTFRITSHAHRVEDIHSFYNIIAQNMRALGSPVHSLGWYESIAKYYADHCFIVLVDFDGQDVGAALVLQNADKAVIPWASTLAEYNRLAPNMLLYWAVLSESVERGASQFDFGRSTVGEGTFNFKKQWGSLPQKLQWQTFTNGKLSQSTPLTQSKLRTFVENGWQRLPLSITNAVGPRLRKHISL